MISQVVYTHSNCKDVWECFLNQNEKNTSLDLKIICNSEEFPSSNKNNIFVYSDEDDYFDVWTRALNNFNLQNFIYLQEDFILYNKVNDSKIKLLKEILNKSSYSFIRLIKSGNLQSKKIHDNLYEIHPCNQDIFSMQPTIWKTSDFIKIMQSVREKKWLETPNYSKYMCENNLSGLYYFENEPKRGLNHHDSNLYPYIATALVRGKWNMSEYKNELTPILKKYNIELNKRGVF